MRANRLNRSVSLSMLEVAAYDIMGYPKLPGHITKLLYYELPAIQMTKLWILIISAAACSCRYSGRLIVEQDDSKSFLKCIPIREAKWTATDVLPGPTIATTFFAASSNAWVWNIISIINNVCLEFYLLYNNRLDLWSRIKSKHMLNPQYPTSL